MLPQFGYIVAQAGADAHLPPFQPSLAPPPPPPQAPQQPHSHSSIPPSQCTTINNNNAFRLTPPPPPPPPATHYLPPQPKWHHEPSPPPPPPPPPSSSMTSYDLYHAATPWDQGPTKLQEYNDLMTAMNREFIDHRTIIYHNKLKSLREDLERLQDGTHEAFMEAVSDLEAERETTIAHAKDMMNYQLSCIHQRFEKELETTEKEYNTERDNVNTIMLSIIRDKRKQIQEDKDHQSSSLTAMFRDHKKRSLRKRADIRKRQYRQSSAEDTEKEELDREYSLMMGRSNSTTAVAAQ
ncbi:hypothetical protein O0I10_008949 [Lichtheimia ornata]|uniref:Uncharacterized protein n=1 Tax=Lichtheimia ornata TaxID=688661 RepID=A0AAD7UZK8_9FUNG|nr:uncharacterized protein O0I10_008949 [Lichtheimia ornata]KAJ8655455.1 hypothetical protein O0I10_008949 [Lichtheimia ornata]